MPTGIGIGISEIYQGSAFGPPAPPSTYFFMLAGGTDHLLQADGTSKFVLAGHSGT